MNTKTPEQVAEALGKLRSELKLKRGYGSRIANKLKVPLADVYNVAWGRVKDARILKALMDEAKAPQTPADEYFEMITDYLTTAAA